MTETMRGAAALALAALLALALALAVAATGPDEEYMLIENSDKEYAALDDSVEDL